LNVELYILLIILNFSILEIDSIDAVSVQSLLHNGVKISEKLISFKWLFIEVLQG
jgi:hypothetical protein